MKKLITISLILLLSLSVFAAPSQIDGIEGKYTYEDTYSIILENNRIFVQNANGTTLNIGIYGEIGENNYICKFSNSVFDLKGEKLINIFTRYANIIKDVQKENYGSLLTELLKLGDHNILECLTFSLTRDQNTGNLVLYCNSTNEYPAYLVGILNVNSDSVREKLTK